MPARRPTRKSILGVIGVAALAPGVGGKAGGTKRTSLMHSGLERKDSVCFKTMEAFLAEIGMGEHATALREHSMDLDLLHEATADELCNIVRLPLGDSKRIVHNLEHASKKHQEQACEQLLAAENSGMDARTLVSTLIVGAAATLVSSASPTELPKTSSVYSFHEYLFTGIVTFAFLSMCCSVYSILAMEFFGDWTLKIEAHINVTVAAMWLKSKETLIFSAESATHYGLVCLMMSTALMVAQKLSARQSSMSLELLVLLTLALLVLPLACFLVRVMHFNKPDSKIMAEINFETEEEHKEFDQELQEQIEEHHEQVLHDVKDHERHREDHAREVKERMRLEEQQQQQQQQQHNPVHIREDDDEGGGAGGEHPPAVVVTADHLVVPRSALEI
jgi:hypothetical protein